ncbi:uncharacterized protein LOC122506746 [Leptopilina heterotoma]|uniref:uncharacterized protein LOC122506746 n=1 Tax=Leptopilina heterotoma TaxID=63436 RepID=UPI001CA83970|nr:uncharacterized protein LOC122506746 [Leptopilina heterotoma]XP_043475003.1 uncharacterized protein LOC122506746 [Leptopilina heterotoma]XP_043475004.1 uncharacterized protein LOC122506746 [Leptopilina heterotoma]XP_043475005.1 uncharacterized protein LOC122506746 [Leptopilina heterotoma]
MKRKRQSITLKDFLPSSSTSLNNTSNSSKCPATAACGNTTNKNKENAKRRRADKDKNDTNLKKTKKDDSLEKNKKKITKKRTANKEEDEEPPMDERKRKRLKRLGTRKSTVKIFLGTICKSNDVKERIIEDAKIVSRMRIEVSLMALQSLCHDTNHYLLEKWTNDGPNYLELFIALKRKINTQIVRDPQFVALIEEYKVTRGNMPLYDCEYRSSIIQEEARKMNREFKTSFLKHFETRLSKLVQHLLSSKDNASNTDAADDEEEEKIVKDALDDDAEAERILKMERRERHNKKKRRNRKKFKARRRKLKKIEATAAASREENHRRTSKEIPNLKIQERRENRAKDNSHREKVFSKRKTRKRKKHSKTHGKRKDIALKNRWSSSASRIRNTLSTRKEAIQVVEKLLNKNVCDIAEFNNNFLNPQEWLNFQNMKQDVNDDGEDDDRNSEWTKFILFMIRVQQYFHDNNIHNFVLVPQAQLGIAHVLYSNTGLEDLKKGAEQDVFLRKELQIRQQSIPFKQKERQIKEAKTCKNVEINRFLQIKNKIQRWKYIFDISSAERGKVGAFAEVMTTNGVDASIIFNVPKMESVEKKEDPAPETRFKVFYGFDPGKKATLGGVRRVRGAQPSMEDKLKDNHIYLKSSSFRWQMNDFRRRERKKEFGLDLQKYYKQYVLENPEKIANFSKTNSRDYKRIIEYKLHLFQRFQELHEQKCVVRLKMDKCFVSEGM